MKYSTIKETLVATFGLEPLSDVRQDEILEKAGELVFEALITRCIPLLSKEKISSYEKLISENVTPYEILTFFNAEIENFQDIAKEEAEKIQSDSQTMEKIGK